MNSKLFAYFSICFGIATTVGTMFLYLLKTTPLNAELPIAPDIFESYGTVVGGVVGPFFALAGVLLLITTIAEQKNVFVKQQIENRFFQLVAITRENSSQVQIGDRSGKKVFISLVRELYQSYETAQDVCQSHQINETDVPNVAYLAFFYGAVDQVSQLILRQRFHGRYTEDFLSVLFAAYKRRRETCREAFDYEVFDGHQSRLGHYYRHLFQAVTYINTQPKDILSYREKYQYIKTLRAQLSTQEQLLFFWNSISDLGLAWEKAKDIRDENDKLITKYNLVKNIPEGYSQYVKVGDYYPLVDYEGLKETPPGRLKLEQIYR